MDRRQFMGVAASGLIVGGSATLAEAAQAAEDERLAGFASSFNGSKSGWQNVVGNWTLKPGNLYNYGIAGKRTSVKHLNNYTNMYYKVRMRRRGNSTGVAANALVLRGNPSSRDTVGNWKPSYLFQYANSGWYSVYRYNADGSYTGVVPWATTSAVYRTGYNIVEVWAYSDGYLDFHINGSHLWGGGDSGGPTFGNVGLSIYTEPGKYSETFVDYANLTILNSRSSRHHTGVSVTPRLGGSVNMAPA